MKLKKIELNKRAIAMSFNWIFALIAGGFILFLAIFAAGKFIRTSEQTIYTETAATLISLFDPLETGLASGKAHEVGFKKKSKIFLGCDNFNNQPFGRHVISFSEQTLGDKYGERGQEVPIKNKYIFSEEVTEGERVFVFSKPFFMPFKVTDITMMISADEKYCIYDSSDYFKENLEGLNLDNIIFMNQTSECEGTNVCFGSRGSCDITVFEQQGYVTNKNYGKRVYFVGDLIFGAVFSSPDIYECNVKRIKRRYDSLVGIYVDKINVIERKDCLSNIGPKLISTVGDIQDSRGLFGLHSLIKEINEINDDAKSGCSLYYNVDF